MKYADIAKRAIAMGIDVLFIILFMCFPLMYILSLIRFDLTFLMIVPVWLYFSVLESSQKQATLGKIWMKIYVGDSNGNRISFATATIRFIGKCLSTVVLFIGYILAVVSDDFQTLHDKLAGTYVFEGLADAPNSRNVRLHGNDVYNSLRDRTREKNIYNRAIEPRHINSEKNYNEPFMEPKKDTAQIKRTDEHENLFIKPNIKPNIKPDVKPDKTPDIKTDFDSKIISEPRNYYKDIDEHSRVNISKGPEKITDKHINQANIRGGLENMNPDRFSNVNERRKRPVLIGLGGEMKGKVFPLGREVIIIGRDTTCHVVFSPGTPGVSRVHCSITFDEEAGAFVLSDLGSTYGTYLDSGARLLKDQIAVLDSGDKFYLGSTKNIFEVRLQ